MGVENVVCPHRGHETLATVPSGHKLVRIVQNPSYQPGPGFYVQMCTCSICGQKFGAVTKEQFT